MGRLRSTQADPIIICHQRYKDAFNTCDIPAILSLYSENAVFMPPNETTLYGKAEIQEWYEEYFEHFRAALNETEREVVIISTDCVAERWAWTVNIVPKKGQRIRDDGRALAIWKRETDGQWRMLQRMFNSIRPIGSGTSRFISRMAQRRGSGAET